MAELSIIIINYNTFDLTTKCIASVYAHTKGVDFEIILVDNKSTNCNPDLFKVQFPEIKLIKNEANLGFAKANNVGILHSSGSVLLLLNSDVEVVNNAISSCYSILRNNADPSVSVVTCRLVYPDGRVQHQCGRFPSITLQLMELLRLQKFLPRKKRENLLMGGFFPNDRSVYPDWIWGTFFMFKKKVLDVFPDRKLSETYFMYCEDLEWCYIIRKHFKIFFDASNEVIHHFGSSSRDFFKEKLNPMIKGNFKDVIKRNKGGLKSSLYFILARLNRLSLAATTTTPNKTK